MKSNNFFLKFWRKGLTFKKSSIGAALVLFILSYSIFNIYLRYATKELMSVWAQTEAISLQEGNLLGSVSKSQRLLMASEFVRGIQLVDLRENDRVKSLARFGINYPRSSLVSDFFSQSARNFHRKQKVVQKGFFKFAGIRYLGNNNDFAVVFFISPTYAPWFFGLYASSLIFFSMMFSMAVKNHEKLESRKREKTVELALNDLISEKDPSQIIFSLSPSLYKSWERMRFKFTEAKNREANLIFQLKMGDVARKLAHDIRGPLSALNMLLGKENNELKTKLLCNVIERINHIAESVLKSSRSFKQDQSHIEVSSIKNVYIPFLLETMIEEKKIIWEKERKIRTDLIIKTHGVEGFGFTQCDPKELQSILSNILNNAYEGCQRIGDSIFLHFDVYLEKIVVTVRDNGCGIPKSAMNRLFEKGFSFGKRTGNGLGLYHAKESIESWGGQIEIISRENSGTIVSLTFIRSLDPDYLVKSLKISSCKSVVVLDDDPSIHSLWQIKFSSVGINPICFLNTESLEEYLIDNEFKEMQADATLFLVDQELGDTTTGVDFVKKKKLSNVVFVTCDPETVVNLYKDEECQIIPKQFINKVDFSFT